MNKDEAKAIRERFYTTPGWPELAECHPRFAEAIAALPDEKPMTRVNIVLREMYEDAKVALKGAKP